MKTSLYLLLTVFLLLFTPSHCATYIPSSITLDPYELAYVNITTGDLSPVIYYSTDFTMEITTSGTEVSFFYPYSKIKDAGYFCFRLFNFGSESKTYNITFSCDDCDFSSFSKVYNVYTDLPSRAVLGTSKVFAIVMSDALLSKVSLPLNLYSLTQETFVDFSMPSFPSSFDYSSLTNVEQIFDSSYWNSINTVTMPWLPFFTHCNQQDRRLLLYDILENSPQECVYKSVDQIKIVKSIPTTGFTPDTDSCHLTYTCFHVQTNKGKSYGTPWYSVTGTKTLYYIYRNPITIEEMLAYKTDTQNSFFQGLINENSDAMIPVTFKTKDNMPQTGIPRLVEMKISFFQVTQEERDIISVEVVMDMYNSSATEYDYTLTITYEALDYFGMINSFRVDIVVYLVVFFFVSVVILLGAWAIWRANKLIFSRKKKMHPTIKFFATFRITFFPQLTGTFYATISTIFVFSLIASYFKSFIDLTGFTPNFLLSSINSTTLLAAERGRIGLACLLFSLFILSKGMALLIPAPTKEETKVIVKNLTKKKERRKTTETDSSDSSKSDASVNDQSSDSLLEGKGSDKGSDQGSNDSQESVQEEVKIDGNALLMGLRRKRNHVMLICILASITLLFVVEPSGATSDNSTSTEASTLLMVLLMLADVVVILLLKHFLLREILLLAPITTAFEIVQFILVMRAETFVAFIWSYLLRTLLIVIFRIYLDPILKNLEVYIQRLSHWFLKNKNRIHQQSDESVMELLRWRNVELILKKPVAHKGNFSIEFIVFILVNYTTKQCARLMFPIYLLFTFVFPNENQITSLFGINQKQLTYYIVFWLFLLIPSFIMDVYILNILEIVHGHKLYDYLSYCEYRFNFRTTKWISSSRQMDRSVSPEHRSIHNFCFSKQFYFTITVTTWGILLFMSGMYIIYANAYKPFADSILVPMLFIVGGCFYALKFVFSKITAYVDLWKQPPKIIREPSKRVEEEKKRLEKHLEVDKMIQTNFFRHFFVRENKDWIINNLKNFIGAENFHDNEGYLLRIYQKLVDEEIRESNEKKRKDFIQQKKYEHLSQLTLKDLNLVAEEDQNNKDDKSHPIEEKVPRVKKSIVKPLTYLLYHWFYFAKQNLYLLNLVADIDDSKLSDHCAKCGQEYALRLVPQKPLVDLLAQFRIQYAGLPFNKYEWRRFYEKKQQFKTLCDDCKFIDIMKKRKNIRRKSKVSSRVGTLDSTKLLNTSQDQQQIDPFESPGRFDNDEDQVKPDIPPPLKKLLLSLHWAAKSKLMHKDKKPISTISRSKVASKKLEEHPNIQSISFDDMDKDDNEPLETQPLFLGKKKKGFESARA